MSFFIFKSSYSLLIFIHMHIDFYLVEHNIYIPLSCLHPKHFPILLQLKGKWSFLSFTSFRIYSWNSSHYKKPLYLDHLSGFQLLLLWWMLGLTKRCYQKQYYEICYSTCYIYLVRILKKFLWKLNVNKNLPHPENLEGKEGLGPRLFLYFCVGRALQSTWSTYTCRMNGLRGLQYPSWLSFGFGSQERQSQVAGTLVPWNGLGFPLSAPWSQPVSLT